MAHKVNKRNITLSVPGKLYEQMKEHPDIKWSEVAREGIWRKIAEVGGVISGKELVKMLPPDSRAALERISKLPMSDWKRYYKEMKESEKRRLKSLTQTS
ncbi:hypothetical protein HYV83_03585 [Candidatus Woesearchaeota archaeon]|nr:hypothetical protein [Candidatus Woesearchaeota archaeon]